MGTENDGETCGKTSLTCVSWRDFREIDTGIKRLNQVALAGLVQWKINHLVRLRKVQWREASTGFTDT